MRTLPGVRTFFGIIWSVWIGVHCCTVTAAEVSPRVEFDTSLLVAVDEVSLCEPLPQGETLIEVRLNISSLLRQGNEQQLLHLLYRIETDGDLAVVDYLPKTELVPATAGNVAVENKTDQSQTIAGSIGGKVDSVNGSLSIARNQAAHGQVKYELLPPKELVAAAGTLGRQSGVYFKLKPSSRSSLEGAKQFVVVFRAPRGWRGERVRLFCDATTMSPPMLGTSAKETPCGHAEFTVGLHRDRDAAARSAVQTMIRNEERWLKEQREYQRRQEKDIVANIKTGLAQTTGRHKPDKQPPAELRPAWTVYQDALSAMRKLNRP